MIDPMDAPAFWSAYAPTIDPAQFEYAADWLAAQSRSPVARRLLGRSGGQIERRQWTKLRHKWDQDPARPPFVLRTIARAAVAAGHVDMVTPDDHDSLQREPSPFLPSSFAGDIAVRNWHEALEAECLGLGAIRDQAGARRLCGLVALALALRSGVYTEDGLQSTIAALLQESMERRQIGRRVFLTSKIDGLAKPLRIPVDRVTDLLCGRLREAKGFLADLSAEETLDEWLPKEAVECLARHCVLGDQAPTSLREVLVRIISSRRLLSEPICVEYCAGAIQSTPYLVQDDKASDRVEALAVQIDSLLFKGHLRGRQEFEDQPWLGDLAGCLVDRETASHDIRNLLRSDPGFRDGVALFVARFALWLIEHPYKKNRYFAVDTVKRYVWVIAHWMAGVPETAAILVNPELLQDSALAFDAALQSGDYRVQLRKALGLFKRFHPLAKVIRLPYFEFRRPVSAIILGENAYQEVLRVLRRTLLLDKSLTRAEVDDVLMIVCLCYRLGLRTSEARLLEVRDVHIQGDSLEIIVQPNFWRRLKTDAARRRMPADALMLPEELAQLRRIVHSRNVKLNEPGLLFQIRQSSKLISRKIAGAMKIVTGNELAVQHHLRHSFGTWTFARLIEASYESSQIRGFFPAGAVPPRLSSAATARLVMTAKGSARDLLYVVQRLMGHARTSTTMANYIHCMSEVCGDASERAMLSYGADSTALIVAASGLSRSTAFRTLHQGGADGLIHRVWGGRGAQNESAPSPRSHWDSIEQLEALAGALNLHRAQGIAYEEIASLFSVDEHLVRNLDARLPQDVKLEAPCARVRAEVATLAERYFSFSAEWRHVVSKGLHAYCRNKWSLRAVAVFTDRRQFADAKAAISSLEKLGIESEFVRFRGREIGPAALPVWARFYARRLRRHAEVSASNGDSGAPSNWIGVRPYRELGHVRHHLSKGLMRFEMLLTLHEIISTLQP